MKHISYHNKTFVVFLLLLLALQMNAQEVSWQTRSTRMAIAADGCFSSIQVEGKEILQTGKYPLITACCNNELITPQQISVAGKLLKVKMKDGETVTLKPIQSDVCVTLEVVDIPEKYDAILFGPLQVSIHDVVGDVIGVAQGDGVAFGIQALNIKTNAGIPSEYADVVKETYQFTGKQAELSVGSIQDFKLAATETANGTMF